MNMQGFGADETFYNRSSRFQSVQLGMGLPLFFGAQKSKINAAKSLKLLAENNYQSAYLQLRSAHEQAKLSYLSTQRRLDYLATEGLINARTIAKAATQKYTAGQINFMEYVFLLNQSVTIENDYFDALRAYNEATVQLNYLSQSK
jgi:cobalt-zinc-cadmium resistance protein CzcA